MSKLKWDQIGEKTYETGVDHGVLYPQKNGVYPKGYAWNGLTTVTENPSGAEDNALYADNMKYLNIKSAEEFGVTIECYTYPDAWAECNGESDLIPGITLGQQRRNTFGLSYRTKKGNDAENEDYGFKLHLVYGCLASPSERGYETINDSPDAITFSFECSTTPVDVPGKDSTGKPFKPTSLIVIDSTKVDQEIMDELERILYGDDIHEARLPLPDELKTILQNLTKPQVKATPVPMGSTVLGKNVDDLQRNLTVEANKITGTLYYVDDFSEFSSKPGEDSGYYIALDVLADDDVEVSFEVVGGTSGEVKVPNYDRQVCARITSTSQSIKFTGKFDDYTSTKIYSLSDLTLRPEKAPVI